MQIQSVSAANIGYGVKGGIKKMQEVFEKIKKKVKDNAYIVTQRNNSKELGMTVPGIMQAIDEIAEEYNNGWIPVGERLPEDEDCRFYMCIVENHEEEEEPMLCQYEEEYGFGFYHDIYDEHTLGFVDSEFKTNEELGYEKVIAWQQIPKYQPKGE